MEDQYMKNTFRAIPIENGSRLHSVWHLYPMIWMIKVIKETIHL